MNHTLVIAKIIVLALFLGLTILSFWFFRHKRKEIALGLSSVLFSIFVAEILLQRFSPRIMEHDKMFQYDSYLGWTFIPNHKGNIVFRGEARHYIETNSWGFRDDPVPTDGQIKKIIVLGDSFVSNIAVKDNEVFTEVMERRLKNTAVLNFGVNGYSQVQEYLLLQNTLAKIRPDLIILIVYVRNDFEENIGIGSGSGWDYPRPFATWDKRDSTFKINPSPQPPPDTTSESFWKFYRRLHLYHLLEGELNALMHKLSQMNGEHTPNFFTPPELYLCRSQMSENTRRMYRTMEELLLRIATYVDERGVPLVFAIAPSIVQVDEELWSSTLLEFGEKSENYVRSLPNDKLMQFAEKNNLLMVDLLPILQSETKKGKKLYYRDEQHWNSDGNRVVAESLVAYLKTRSLIE